MSERRRLERDAEIEEGTTVPELLRLIVRLRDLLRLKRGAKWRAVAKGAAARNLATTKEQRQAWGRKGAASLAAKRKEAVKAAMWATSFRPLDLAEKALRELAARDRAEEFAEVVRRMCR